MHLEELAADEDDDPEDIKKSCLLKKTVLMPEGTSINTRARRGGMQCCVERSSLSDASMGVGDRI